MTHVDVPRTRRTLHTRPTGRPWLAIVGAYLVTLLFFPVQMLAVGMLVCGALMFMSIYVLWTQTHRMGRARHARLDRSVLRFVFGAVALGAIAAFVWPPTMAVVAFATTVSLCALWFVMERKAEPPIDW